MAEPGDYSVLDGSDNGTLSVLVPQHDDSTRRSAFRIMLDHLSFIDDDSILEHSLQAERDILRPLWLAQHTSVDTLEECGCENETWWCENGDGPRSAAWSADRAQLWLFIKIVVLGHDV